MKVHFWVVGKTSEAYLESGIKVYVKRLGHYLPFTYETIPDVKNAGKKTVEQLKELESQAILGRLQTDDYLVLLDEKGKTFTSVEFSQYLDRCLQKPHRRLIFLVGGAYGFDKTLYKRADEKLSLSSMTFSHRMVRLFFLEQLYRAVTILRNEPYHNE
jgi:23S rRNA (pseudouridine1915-N3)-methyltransferase